MENKKFPINVNSPYAKLALISAGFALISRMMNFLIYPHQEVGFLSFIGILLSLVPIALTAIYFLVYHDQSKATELIPLTFAALAAAPIWRYMTDVLSYGFEVRFAPLSLMSDIAIAVLFVLATLDAMKGFSQKIFLLIALTFEVLMNAFSLLNALDLLFSTSDNSKLTLYLIFVSIGSIAASVALYATWFVFVFKNGLTKTPVFPPIEKPLFSLPRQNDPARELKALNEKYSRGEISEEEYKARREEIINKF